MQRPIIRKGKIYATTYIMQGGNICKNLYAKTYNMQGQNICKDL